MISARDKLYRWRYPVAIVGTGLSYFAGAGLQPILGARGWMVLISLAVVFSALNGGFGPMILAVTMSVILATFVIFEPRGLLASAEIANLLTPRHNG